MGDTASTPNTARPARPAGRPNPIVGAVLSHANRVHGVLQANNHPSEAERLALEAERWKADATTVVVAGDIKRGKSSLINALLDRPDLVPVDADVATAVHLVIRHGDTDRAEVTFLDGETRTISFDDIAQYASVRGASAELDRVAAVDIMIDHPLLARGLHIVDTPGVGGMAKGHRDITMAALNRADVFVFVVSLQEPVARTELEFLADASDRIGTVVLVGSRADLSTDEDNAKMVADISQRIQTLASDRDDGERLARLGRGHVITTSAHMADQARRRYERGQLDRAEEIRSKSGLTELTAQLERSLDAREHLRLANLLQLVGTVLSTLELDEQTRARAMSGDSTVQAELEQRQRDLERAASNQARWRATLATGMSRLQTAANRDVSRELNEVRDHYRTVLNDQQDETALAAVSDELQQSLVAAWTNLADHVGAQFATVIDELLRDLEIETESEPDLFQDLDLPPAVRELSNRTDTSRGGAEFDLMQDGIPLATQTFMFGNIANALVGVLGLATGGLGLAAYGVGIAVAAPIVAIRRKQRARHKVVAELQRELGEALFGQEGVAREFNTELSLRILDARERLELMIDERLIARRKSLEQQRQELMTLLKTEQSERARHAQESERLRAEIAGLQNETQRLVDTVDQELQALMNAQRSAI